MKKLLLAIFTISSLLFSSCKDGSIPTTNAASVILDGTWKVTLHSEGGIDNTSYFGGYALNFTTGNTVTAVKAGASNVNGTWAKGVEDTKEKLLFAFLPLNSFEQLNENWRVLEATNTKVRLEHVGGGIGVVELLTLEKN